MMILNKEFFFVMIVLKYTSQIKKKNSLSYTQKKKLYSFEKHYKIVLKKNKNYKQIKCLF